MCKYYSNEIQCNINCFPSISLTVLEIGKKKTKYMYFNLEHILKEYNLRYMFHSDNRCTESLSVYMIMGQICLFEV